MRGILRVLRRQNFVFHTKAKFFGGKRPFALALSYLRYVRGILRILRRQNFVFHTKAKFFGGKRPFATIVAQKTKIVNSLRENFPYFYSFV